MEKVNMDSLVTVLAEIENLGTSTDEKGTLVDGYGTAAAPATADFMRKVNDIPK